MQFNKAYNRQEFVSFLRNSFLPDDFHAEEAAVSLRTQTKFTSSVTKLGTCSSLDLVVYEIRHRSKNDARVGLSKEAFRVLADEWEDRALVIFVPEESASNYRFSLITVDLDMTETGKLNKRYSNPRRYSYFLGSGIATHTPDQFLLQKGRVIDDVDLKERFSVEVLTKAFYNELSDWYAWAVKTVRFPNNINDPNDDDKYNAESTIRLVTRLIFVWFLKQKNLIPGEFFDESFIANNLIEGFDPNAIVTLFGKSEESVYYKAILQNLFFAMLNTPITPEGKDTISERRFRTAKDDHSNTKLLRYEKYFIDPSLFLKLANSTVPFLNGGLFDCLDEPESGNYIDGFSDREQIQNSLIVPDYLFFGEEVGKNIDLSEWYGDANKKKVSARGIIDILKRYNFTVEENTPYDQDVSLDPELLGKVFENLLASYNPETKTTARKQTGSFYTPREIVQYMVDESIVAHLNKTVGKELEQEYRKLLSYTDDEINLSEKQKSSIIQALYDCKVLDPACGSGAFPVGALQQMVHILSELDPSNSKWEDIVLERAVAESEDENRAVSDEDIEERRKDIERSFNESLNYPDYARKLYLIENCIYGIDIQPIAIQISKLRFFISLVVDQKTTKNPVENFGIRPLPNLEAKFVVANTLVPLMRGSATLFDRNDISELEKSLVLAKHKIFNAKTPKTKRKYKDIVKQLREEIADKMLQNGVVGNQGALQLTSWDMFDQNTSSPFFDAEWMFGISGGFDIVIGNPPYLVIQKSQYPAYEWNTDLYKLFFERGLKVFVKKEGVLCYISPKFYLLNKDDKSMREYFLNNVNITSLALCNPFEAVTENVITTIVIQKPTSKFIPCFEYSDEAKCFERIEDLDREYCFSNEQTEMIVGLNPRVITLLDKMKGNNPMLKDVSVSKRGAEVGKKFLRSQSSGMKSLIGMDMKKYQISWSETYLPYSHKEYSRLSRFFNQQLIYLRRVDSCLEATISDEVYAFNKNVYGIYITDSNRYSIKYILALLNSSAVDYYYKNRFSTKKTDAFPEIQTYLYEQLPLPVVNKELRQEIESLVDEVIEKKKKSDYTQVLEAKIDEKVFEAFGLEKSDIELILNS